MHRIWLGEVYEWAGQYRQVNISKGNFPFAMALQVPTLMEQLEQGPLRDYTPCMSGVQDEVIYSLAVVHTELALIHPFREGDGRLGTDAGRAHGSSGGIAALGFQQHRGKGAAGVVRRGTGRAGGQPRPLGSHPHGRGRAHAPPG